MRLKRLLRAMFPNWLNVIVFVVALLTLIVVLWIASRGAYQKAHQEHAYARGRSAPQLGQNTNAR